MIRGQSGTYAARLGTRFLASSSMAVGESTMATFPQTGLTKTTTHTLDASVSSRPTTSTAFLTAISLATFSPNKVKDTHVVDRRVLLKQHIQVLVNSKKFGVLLEFLLQWVRNSSLDSSVSIETTLTKTEISELLAKIVRHQVYVLHNFTLDSAIISTRTGTKTEPQKNSTFMSARKMKNEIRELVSCLLYGSDNEFIYDLEKKQDLYLSSTSTGYTLAPADYESMIYLEMHNHKYDLASLWFRHFIRQYLLEQMPYKMWIMRFQLFSGGYPSFWKIGNTALSSQTAHNPGKSYFKHKISFSRNFYELLETFKKTGSKLVLNDSLTETLIYSIGYSKDTSYLDKFLRSRYGIGIDGSVIEKFSELHLEDANLPSVRIIKAVFLSLAYNGMFFEGLTCVNAYQQHYNISLDTTDSKTFWELVFKWCDITTKHDDSKTLPYFLKYSDSKKPKTVAKKTLEEAMEDVDFDYASYLNFKNDLQKRRIETFDSLWGWYMDNGSVFSKQIFKVYLEYLKEELDEKKVELNYYSFLNMLANEESKYHTSPLSFNKRSDGPVESVKNYDDAIYVIYMDTMKALIDYKWKSTYAGQCLPIIQKWSLDENMKKNLTNWFNVDRLPRYRNMIEKKRVEFMVNLRTEEKEDPFLDII